MTDGVLSFYLDFLSTSHPSLAHSLAPLNPGVASLCQVMSGSDLAECLCNTGLSASCSSLLLPLSDSSSLDSALSGTHWSLLHWQRSTGFSHYDSAASAGSGRSLQVASLVAARLSPLLGLQEAAPVVVSRPCPQQANHFDCGMHVAASMEFLVAGLAGAPLAAPAEASSMRARILAIAAQAQSPGSSAFWAAQAV